MTLLCYGPDHIFGTPSGSVRPTVVIAAGVTAWSCMLVKIVAFWDTLHCPADSGTLGVVGISFLELLKLNGLWAGGRLVLERASQVPWSRLEELEVAGIESDAVDR